MAKAVFIQNPASIYDDQPGVAYHFPRQYLGTVQRTIGDWVIFYEGRKGAFGYTSIQRVKAVVPDTTRPDHFYAVLERATRWEFEQVVHRARADGVAYERSLRGPDGRPSSGGANVSAVRSISDDDFWAIVRDGLSALHSPDSLARNPELDGVDDFAFAEAQVPFGEGGRVALRPEVLTMRKYRDPSFQRLVKNAYGSRCAISGIELRNGGGRPEVQAAHIMPVKDGGPDTIDNGLALSGTVHWMFDRGLISVAEDHRILVSHNKVPKDVADRLIAPDQKLYLPKNKRFHPHPEYLRFHREEVFGGV